MNRLKKEDRRFKLSQSEVLRLRAVYKGGLLTVREVARAFNVSRGYCSRLITGDVRPV